MNLSNCSRSMPLLVRPKNWRNSSTWILLSFDWSISRKTSRSSSGLFP